MGTLAFLGELFNMNLTKYFHQPTDFYTFDTTRDIHILLNDEQEYIVVDYSFALSVEEYKELIEEGQVGIEGGNLVLFNQQTNQIEQFTMWTNEFENDELPSFYICFRDYDCDDYTIHLLSDLIEYNEQTIQEKITKKNLVAYQNIQTKDIFVFSELDNKFNKIIFSKDKNEHYIMNTYIITLNNGVPIQIGVTIYQHVFRVASSINMPHLEAIFHGIRNVHVNENNQPFILVNLNNITHSVYIETLFHSDKY